jgi:hypothetical protein
MAVQTENQTSSVDVGDRVKGDSNGVRPKIIRAIDEEGGTTDAKVCFPLSLRAQETIYIHGL